MRNYEQVLTIPDPHQTGSGTLNMAVEAVCGTDRRVVPRLGISFSTVSVKRAILSVFQRLGFDRPSEDQEKAVTEFLYGQDVFVGLPTGSGKSMCFICLPLVYEHLRYVNPSASSKNSCIVLVLSPLVALMKDQVRKYSAYVKCAFIGELDSNEELEKAVVGGEYQVVYASPEAVVKSPQWRNMLSSEVYTQNIVAIVVDEAHCITSW